VVVKLTSGEGRRLGVKRGKCCVTSKAKYRDTTTMKCVSRDCHNYHLLPDWSGLTFSLFERLSSENITCSTNMICAILRWRVQWLSHLAPTIASLTLIRLALSKCEREDWKAIKEVGTHQGVFWKQSGWVVNPGVRWCCQVHPEAWEVT